MSAAGSVMWHDVECGPYVADLRMWEELAAVADGPILELGCGTGRVALHLAKLGHEVTGIDTDPALVGELNARAERSGLSARAITADAGAFELDRRFAIVIAPMQIVQILGGPERRRAMLARVAAHLGSGGRFAVAIVTEADLDGSDSPESDGSAPLPDVREEDGWVYSSLPVAVAKVERGGLAIERLRQVVSPQGDLSEQEDTMMLDLLSPADLAAEAAPEGLSSVGTREIATSDRYIGSTVCILELR